MITPPETRRLPKGFRVALDPQVRTRDGGSVLIGGSPLRLLRLAPRAGAVVVDIQRGCAHDVEPGPAVARALLDGGLAHPRPGPGGPTPEEVTVVVPARDRPDALARCLAAIGPCGEVIVVDDASQDPDATVTVATDAGARVLRRACNGGPAAARNTGLRQCITPYVAFVDSDCEPEPGWLARLLPHFRDPAVGVVAPRILPVVEASGWLAPYERVHSALDLGAREGPVRPSSRIAYIPGATLVARRSALGAGFNEAMRAGEDVDLVWRLHAAGWTVRYEPGALVWHAHRQRIREWVGRRHTYGTTAAPLALAHPGKVPPLVMSPWSLGAWALLLARRPWLAAAVTLGVTGALARQLPLRSGRTAEAFRLACLGTFWAGEQLPRAVTRAWWPVLAPAVVASRRGRAWLGAACLAPPLLDWARERPKTDPLRYLAAHVLDDVAYSTGVWRGCVVSRSAAPLLPRLTRVRGQRTSSVTSSVRSPNGDAPIACAVDF